MLGAAAPLLRSLMGTPPPAGRRLPATRPCRQRPVVSAVFLASTSRITYKYGATDATFGRLRPSHLLFRHTLRTACENGYRWFDCRLSLRATELAQNAVGHRLLIGLCDVLWAAGRLQELDETCQQGARMTEQTLE
jgi:hypothetical protein